MASVNLSISPWFGSGALTSPELRYALGALCAVPAGSNLGSETGVFPSVNGLLVSGGSGLVTVQPGACVVQNAVTAGTYVVTVPIATNVAVTAQATNARIDRVCVQVQDSDAGDGSGVTPLQARLFTVEGTPAASPTPATPPSGSLILAEIRVSSSGITNVTDKRQFTRASGGIRVGTTNDTRSGSYPGDTRVWSDGRIDIWTGSAWVSAAAPSVWTQTNVTYNFDGFGGNPAGQVSFGSTGTSFVRYKRAGNDLTVSYAARYGGTGLNGGTGNITTTLPGGMVGQAQRDQWIPCQLWVNNSDSGISQDWAGMALIQSNSNVVRPYFPWNTGPQSTGIAPHKIANSVGVPGFSVPYVAGGFAQGGTIHIGPGVVEVA